MVEDSEPKCCCGAGRTDEVYAGDGDKPAACRETLQTDETDAVLSFADRLGSWRARWCLGRMKYTVRPGLYALGAAGPDSHVFVSANYKMSFDRLRSQLDGRDAWILVLDTKGINVWCAAGEGTFGTEELVYRVDTTRLSEVVSHKQLIVPQLGAPGVSAHEVKKRSGFKVIYGPVRAQDLPAFLDAEMVATPEMRRVRFGFFDRLVLVPVEIVVSAKYLMLILACMFLLAGLGSDGYSSTRAISAGSIHMLFLLGAYLAGTALTPAFLPCWPGRAFSVKGLWAGFVLLVAVGMLTTRHPVLFESGFSGAAWLLLVPAISSFLAMNFTGASTYTSLSGVRKEMKIAVPLQIAGVLAGSTLWIIGRFV